MKSEEERYKEFASRVSFFEFTQEEFKPARFQVTEYEDEIAVLGNRHDWDISTLADFIQTSPRSFVIFENIFQLERFTDAQLIHFVFDVAKLNSENMDAVFEYAVYNLKNDPAFFTLFPKEMGGGDKTEDYLKTTGMNDPETVVAQFKRAIPTYIKTLLRKPELLRERITRKEFADLSVRIANYLLKNLNLNSTLASINLKQYLANKRAPRDTKSIHGNFATQKAIRILETNGFINTDSELKKTRLTLLPADINTIILERRLGKPAFCTEKSITGVNKQADGKPKKFDLIIFGQTATHLFEINFYTTEGTKIGINENEYVELYKSIQDRPDFVFHWITDGNYWLSPQGRTRYLNLIRVFGQVLNLNLFAASIDSFK